MQNSLTFQSGILVFARSIEKIVTLLLFIVLSRYLSKEDYGTYRQLLLLFSTFSAIFMLGLPASINYFVPQFDNEKRKAILLQTMLILFCMGIFMAIIFWQGSSFFSKFMGNPELENLLKYFSLFPVFVLPTLFYQEFLICSARTKQACILSIILSLLKFLCVLIPVLLNCPLIYIVYGLVIFSIIQFLVISIDLYYPFRKIKTALSFVFAKEQLLFALPLALSAIISILLRKVDQFMVSYYFTPDQYAIYSNGAMEVPFLAIITNSVVAVLMPYLVRNYKNNKIDDFIHKWKNSIIKTSLVVFPISIFLIFFAKEAIIILFSKKYTGSIIIFQIYLLLEVVRITNFGYILLALGKPKFMFKYNSIALVINIIMNLLLIKLLGLIGPAIATVISIYVVYALELKKIVNILNVKLIDIIEWKKIGYLLIIILFLSGTLRFLTYNVTNIYLSLLLNGSIFAICYFLFVNKYFKGYIPNIKHFLKTRL
jgi:O-antigen/teichoic acid export membrane protein